MIGTKIEKRLKRGDVGINPLDEACKEHDISYLQHKDLNSRHAADKRLQTTAWTRVKADDSSFGERMAALTVAGVMKAKRKLGLGLKVSMRKAVVNRARKAISKFKKMDMTNKKVLREGASVALAAAKVGIKEHGGSKRIRKPRVIPIPKTGGILPLIPVLAGLSALGSLAGGAAGIARAVNDVKSTRKSFEEANRHNKTMEAIALRNGRGLHMRVNRKGGLGFYLSKHQKN